MLTGMELNFEGLEIQKLKRNAHFMYFLLTAAKN